MQYNSTTLDDGGNGGPLQGVLLIITSIIALCSTKCLKGYTNSKYMELFFRKSVYFCLCSLILIMHDGLQITLKVRNEQHLAVKV